MSKDEKIKVKVFQLHPDTDIQEKESIKIYKKEMLDNAENFLRNEFSELSCENCDDESKGTVVVSMNTENKGALLYFNDFCCSDFEHKAKSTLK